MGKLFASLSAAATLLLCSSISADAGTLTLDSGQPSFSPGGAFSNNTITAQINNNNLVQILGSTNIAVTPGGFVTISVSGSFSADTGDIFSFIYNFGINLDSNVPVAFTLEGTANTQYGPVMVSDSGALLQGNHQYSGMGQSSPAPLGLTGTYTGALTFNFGTIAPKPNKRINGVPNNTMFLNIPTDGLDFQVGPTAIPEPSTYALVGLGLGALIWMAKRRLLA